MTTRLPNSLALVPASVLWLLSAACSGTVDAGPEELATAAAATIQWDPKSQMKQIASTRGCDSWMPTWAPDGNLYSAVGDCRMRGVPEKIGMGFARISGSTGYGVSVTAVPTGDPLDWDDAATGAGVDALGDGPASEKSAGMLHVGGRLWFWIRNINAGGTGMRLKFSDNYSSASPDFTWVNWSVPQVGYASFVQYGRGYAGGPAGYVYAVVPMRSSSTGSVSNSAYDMVPAFGLMRGLRRDLSVQSNWEYFCGVPSNPAWCSTTTAARNIVFKSGRKFKPRAGMSWNPGLRKFMLTLVYDPTPSTTADDTRFIGGLMVLVSANPWGPWQTVFSSGGTWPGGTSTVGCQSKGWGAGDRADIPTKYMSSDGKTFFLFSSGGDCLSIARGILP